MALREARASIESIARVGALLPSRIEAASDRLGEADHAFAAWLRGAHDSEAFEEPEDFGSEVRERI